MTDTYCDGTVQPHTFSENIRENSMISKRVALLLCFFVMLSAGKIYASDLSQVCNSVCAKIREIVTDSPFVVAVYTERSLVDAKGEASKGAGIGTGIVIALEGGTVGVLTNNHVIDEPLASRIWVSFAGQEFMQTVTVVGRDPAADLALLSAPRQLPSNMRPAVLAKQIELGQQVYALGYPFGVRSPSFGYVNTKESFSWLYAWTQAPANPGNSGGPVFNEKHEVVGINTAIIRGATTTFVFPIEYVHKILPRLMREGVVHHAATGFTFEDASHISPIFFENLGLKYPPEEDWVMALDIDPGSYAARAGVTKGDVIIRFNGAPVKSARDLDKKIFFDHHPNEPAVFTMRRGAQEFERHIVLTERSSK